MGILYSIQKEDGTEIPLNTGINTILDGSLTYGEDSFSVETRLIPNSFLPGDVQIGSARPFSRPLSFSASIVADNNVTFRAAVNAFISALSDAVFLIDKTDGIRIPVVLQDSGLTYDTGALKRSANINFTFTCLNPFWEDDEALSQSDTLTALVVNPVSINNDGFYRLLPIFTIAVSEACSYVDIQLGNQSLRVEDSIFGTTGNTLMTINNEKGIVIVGQFNRTTKIVDGLGFIGIPTGVQTLSFITPVASNLTTTYRRRFYV